MLTIVQEGQTPACSMVIAKDSTVGFKKAGSEDTVTEVERTFNKLYHYVLPRQGILGV